MTQKKSKHILFIVENNPAQTDRRVWSEALTAKQLGYHVSVICPESVKEGRRSRCIDGIDIYEHPRPHEGSGISGLLIEYANALIWETILSLRIFFRNPFDVIHAANPPDHLFLIAVLFKPFGVKFIFDHHDIAPETFFAKFGRKGIFYAILHVMELLTFKTADIVISTNESYKKIAVERGGKCADEVFVVRNGPDLSQIPSMEPNNSLRKGFKYLVGYVGVLGQQEGMENLLDAVKYTVEKRNRTDIRFIVVGKGPQLKSLIRMCHVMGISQYVWFTGFIPDRDLYEILATADVCVNPEFSNEFTDKSTMIKIMEYMAFGKPIVQYETTEGKVSAADASVYITENSVTEFADAVISLLDDPEKRRLMGQKGRKRIVDMLGWHHQKLCLKKAYESIFGCNDSKSKK